MASTWTCRADVVIVNGTASHRVNMPGELAEMVGEDVFRHYRVVNHRCRAGGHLRVGYLQHLDASAAGETREFRVGRRDGGSVPRGVKLRVVSAGGNDAVVSVPRTST